MKPSVPSELYLPLSEGDSDLPRYQQVFRQLQKAILDGTLKPGSRLPSSRALSDTLGISRNTVKTAFEILLAEGYIETHHGAGSFVAENLPSAPSFASKPSNLEKEQSLPPLSELSKQLSEVRRTKRATSGLLAPGKPCLESFPWKQWQQQMTRATRQLKFEAVVDAQGYKELRQQIASYLNITRGMHCTEHQILICSGSQQAIYLTLAMILNKGDTVLVEDPGYEGIDGAIVANQACRVPVAVDQHGFKLKEGLSKAKDAKAAIVTPSRSYPLGHTLSLERRLELLDWAANNQRWIIEDDYDSDFRFDGPPLTSLHGLDNKQCVIYTGTFSRVLHPAIRLGYLVVPESLASAFKQAKHYMDGGVPLIPQMALSAFMFSGQFTSHVRRMRKLYAERREYLDQCIQRQIGTRLIRVPSDGGMHSVYLLADGRPDVPIAEKAKIEGLGIRALSCFYLDTQAQQGLVISFSSYNQEQIGTGVTILASVIKGVVKDK